jgi:hypothetical protein
MFHAEANTESIISGHFARLPQFDLTPIRARVAREHSELTTEELDDLERRYLQFLMKCKAEPTVRNSPDTDVDWYWHTHILDTQQYAADCQRYFGFFLHHKPNEQGCDDGCGAVSL